MCKVTKRLDETLKIAIANPVRKVPRMASTIWHKNTLIGVGLNDLKTHPWQKRFSNSDEKICIHAEVAALHAASRIMKNLSSCTLYIARAMANDNPGMAKPCKVCAGAIEQFGITKVYWTEGN